LKQDIVKDYILQYFGFPRLKKRGPIEALRLFNIDILIDNISALEKARPH